MAVEILGELKSEANRTSLKGSNDIKSAISILESTADIEAEQLKHEEYNLLELFWNKDRNTASVSIYRDIGQGAISLVLNTKYIMSDKEWQETRAELLLKQDEDSGYAVSETLNYWPDNHVSNYPRRGDSAAELSLTEILRLSDISISDSYIDNITVDKLLRV